MKRTTFFEAYKGADAPQQKPKQLTSEEINQANMRLIEGELRMYGAPLKRTGSGGYLGHGHRNKAKDYQPNEDVQYAPTKQ